MAATEIAQGSDGSVQRWAGGKKMPAKMQAIGKGKYKVSTPNSVHAKNTSKENAESQVRLLNAVEHSDWRPSGVIGGSRHGIKGKAK
jgi:hypothetical protein